MTSNSYALICGSPGVGLSASRVKFEGALEDAVVEDVEESLCKSPDASAALNDIGSTQFADSAAYPTMYQITWHLTRNQVIRLWQTAASNCFFRLKKSTKAHKILLCHFVLRCGRRGETFSVIDRNRLALDLKPSHVVVLIDDVYDMYLRLAEAGQLFDAKTRFLLHLGRICEDEGLATADLADEDLTFLSSEWQLGVMSDLLQWRNLEIVVAEKIANELGAKFMVWGIKQLTEAISLWLKDDNHSSIYLSHPISRPRREFQKNKRWPDVVDQFNKLQREFLREGMTCVMPSAIDEYRICKENNTGIIRRRTPLLEDRWPLPGRPEELLYACRSDMNGHHNNILALKRWDMNTKSFIPPSNPDEALLGRIDIILRNFEQQIEREVTARDHFFVSATDGILVFRPFFLDGLWSSGVSAELRHWSIVANENRHKRAAIIHFLSDVSAFLDLDTTIQKCQGQIEEMIVDIVSREHGHTIDGARQILQCLEQGPVQLLDGGITTPEEIRKIRESLPEYKRRAQREWLLDILSGAEVGLASAKAKSQVAVWVMNNEVELPGKYSEIAGFLNGGPPPDESSFEILDTLLHNKMSRTLQSREIH